MLAARVSRVVSRSGLASSLQRAAPRVVAPVRQVAAKAAASDPAKMSMKLYVGNLSWDTRQDDLQNLFSKYGTVEDAFVATDRETGRSRGFGFVTLEANAAKTAAAETDGTDFMGRTIRVNEATPPGERREGGGGRGYGRGGGRGGYGGGYGGDRGDRGYGGGGRGYGGGGGGRGYGGDRGYGGGGGGYGNNQY